MKEVLLQDLPPEHPLRNRPLAEIGAWYLVRNGTVWREAKATFGISKVTYNQLGEVWTKWDKWKATNLGP